MDFLFVIERLGAALAIGVLIGVERGWKQREREDATRVAGLRTYSLIGLLGGIAGLLSGTLGVAAFAALTLGFALPWLVFKTWEVWQSEDVSITGLIAGLTVYALGALAATVSMQAAAAAAVVVTVILAFKSITHAWLRMLSWTELRSALVLLAATLIALPLLPNRALDPWNAFNPRELWLLTIMLASVSFAGYAALRSFGPRRGLMVGGLAAALVSSTAMTIDMARRSGRGEVSQGLAAAVTTAGNAVMIGRVGVFVALFAPQLLPVVGPPLAAAGLLSLLAGLIVSRRRHDDTEIVLADAPGNPLDLRFIVRVALLLAAITVLARLATHLWSSEGIIGLAAIAGLVDVDAITLAVSRMVPGDLAVSVGAIAILTAVASDTLSKAALAIMLGRRRFALPYALASVAALAVGGAVVWIQHVLLASPGG